MAYIFQENTSNYKTGFDKSSNIWILQYDLIDI